jgi:hypothetical protein
LGVGGWVYQCTLVSKGHLWKNFLTDSCVERASVVLCARM